MDKQLDNSTLDLDDGLEAITIKNRFGDELGVFYFRPTDSGIVDRYNKAITMIDAAVEPLQKDITGSTDDETLENFTAAMDAAKAKLCAAFDYLFDAPVGEVFFSKVSPFTLCNGRFYCENVMEAIGNFIEARMNREVSKLRDRTAKYTHGYRTGKHKGGKK